MKKLLLILLILFFASSANAAITFTNGYWSTTYDCPAWTSCSDVGSTCDGLNLVATANARPLCEEVTASANYTSGGGGLGQRHMLNASHNGCTGVVNLIFPTTIPEFWIRFYIRFQLNMNFVSDPQGGWYYKILYIDQGQTYYHETDFPKDCQPSGHCWNITNGGSYAFNNTSGYGWNDLMAAGADGGLGKKSDGQWHCMELHLKTNSGGSNGIAQLWVDGVLKTDISTANFNADNFVHIYLGSNHTTLDGIYAVDYDDIAVAVPSWAGPWQYDSMGHPMIGPLGYTPPSYPVMSNGAPVNNFTEPSGTTTVTMSLDTSVNSKCRYDSADIAYGSMATPFTTGQDTTSHSSNISVTVGSYTRYVRCDTVAGGNPTPASLVLSWNVPSAPVPPVLSTPVPSNGFVFPLDTTQTTLGITTDKLATCKYGTVANTAYASIANTFTTDSTPQITHSSLITGLTNGSSYTYYIRCDDGASGVNLVDYPISFSVASVAPPPFTTLLTEHFDDTDLAGRGWYDQIPTSVIDATEMAPTIGNAGSLKCWWASAAQKPTSGNSQFSFRHDFTATDSVYFSFWIKHTSNWAGSNRLYHPHMFYFLTDRDPYGATALDYLNVYVEEHCSTSNPGSGLCGGVLQMQTQDGKNINSTYCTPTTGNGCDAIVAATESRAVAGCNGDSDGHGGWNGSTYANQECLQQGGVWYNSKWYPSTGIYFADTAGDYYKGDWHFIETYFKLNSISNGIGQTDGIMQMWYDGVIVYNYNDIVYRTNANPSMRFTQLVIGPYISDGSPVNNQGFWIDELTVATGRSGNSVRGVNTLGGAQTRGSFR